MGNNIGLKNSIHVLSRVVIADQDPKTRDLLKYPENNGFQSVMRGHPSVTFKVIEHGSPEYKSALHLSEEILRKPLGLTFSQEELEKEKDYVQIVGFRGDELIATVALVPEGEILRMRRVVVRDDLQNQGIASAMMKFCEEYALANGFKEIYCHARQTAVPFYKKNDYLSEGDSFLEQTIPHRKMWKTLVRKA